MSKNTYLDKDAIAPKIGEMFTIIAAGVAKDGYTYFALFSNLIWAEHGGKLGLMASGEDRKMDVGDVTGSPFVLFSVGIDTFYARQPRSELHDGKSSCAVAFPTAEARDRLIEEIYRIPFYTHNMGSVVKGEWKENKLDIPLDNTVRLERSPDAP